MSVPQLPVISNNANPAELKAAFEKLRVYFAYVQKTGGFTAGTTTTIIQESTGGGTEPVYDIPTPPTNLTVSGAFNSILLQWDHPVYSGHAYTEVWRYDSDDLGNADYIGATEASMYSDTPPDSSLTTTYYYWVRHVNRNMVNGTFNATPGTAGTTADDPEYVLELLLDSKWKATTARALNFIGYPTTPNGFAYKATTAGTSGATEPDWSSIALGGTITDGTIVWTCLTVLPMTLPFEIGLIGGVPTPVLKSLLIGDATITSAKIQSLAADKITTGYLAAARIEVGTLNGDKLIARTVAADRIVAGAITANEIAAQTITGNKITGTTITGDKIVGRTISADKITAGAITVTEIYGLARINGNRLNVVSSGAGYLWNTEGLTVTHNLGRLAMINIVNQAAGLIIESNGVNSFVIRFWDIMSTGYPCAFSYAYM